jgi:hypothetical protein
VVRPLLRRIDAAGTLSIVLVSCALLAWYRGTQMRNEVPPDPVGRIPDRILRRRFAEFVVP